MIIKVAGNASNFPLFFLLQTAGAPLAFKGLTLDGQKDLGVKTFAAVQVLAANLYAEDVVFQNFAGNSVPLYAAGSETQLKNVKFLSNDYIVAGGIYCFSLRAAALVAMDSVSG